MTESSPCHDFQLQLADLVASHEAATHPHLLSCPRCQALLADLESIAEAARLLLAPVEPPDALWSQIETAIERDHLPPEKLSR